MIQKTLKNGLRLIIDKKKQNSIALQVTIHTGSNDEPAHLAGISHFIEHLIFEGTTTRSAKEIAESIEKTGGEFNAMTTNEFTAFYIKVPKEHKKLAITILHDIVQNSVFNKQRLEKERRVILEEIKMTQDEPSHYQWILLMKTLFDKHPAGKPIAGTQKSVKSITREDILSFFRIHYVPKNMIVGAQGDISVKDLSAFNSLSGGVVKHAPYPAYTNKKRTAQENRRIQQTYYIRAWAVPGYNSKDRYAFDILSAILSKGLSGRIVESLRNEKGLAYACGAKYDLGSSFGMFVFHVNCSKKNLSISKELITEEIKKLHTITPKELEEAKTFLIGKRELELEDALHQVSTLSEAALMNVEHLDQEYPKHIKKVNLTDLYVLIKKHLTSHYTEVTLK